VTDNSGALGKDTVQVSVLAAVNIAPKAIAGVDQTITLPTNAVTLSGSGTDADGTISSYKWNKITGPAQFTVVSSTLAQTAVNGLVEGVYTFELVVTDNNGSFGKDTVKIIVLSSSKGDSNNHNNYSVKLFPNPATSNIYVSFKSGQVLNILKIQIYNSRGKKLWSTTLNDTKEVINLAIDVSAYCKGIYFVNFISGKKTLKTIRFIKL
jgi:hypothetical protein